MRIRHRNRVILKNVAVIFLLMVPSSFVGAIVWQINDIYSNITQFQYENPPDPTEFITANYTRLGEMIRVYDNLFEQYHLPLNFTASATFKDGNYSEIDHYSYSDNGALWTGLAMNGFVHKYLAGVRENNQTLQDDAIRVIRRMISGMAMMMIVPNGGLGSDYSGILARGWAGPEHKSIAPMYFQQNKRHFNGTGIYSQYRWRGYTSNDEYGGYYMGLALALKYIPDSYVQETVSLIVDQLCNYMLNTNFLGISGTGNPTGVNQRSKFGGGTFWIPTLLKMGAICYPEKYEHIYYHYLMENWYYLFSNEGGEQEVVSNYYAYNFEHCVVFAFLTLEDRSTNIWHKFYDKYYNSIRQYTAYHRNAYFNNIYLLLSNTIGQETIVERDIEDQLMRMEINHFPDRAFKLKTIPNNWPLTTRVEYWKKWTNNNPYGSFFKIFTPEIDFESIYYSKALTVEYKHTGNLVWERNPFEQDSSYYYSYDNSLFEMPGLSFIVPYWMGRAAGFILPSGERVL